MITNEVQPQSLGITPIAEDEVFKPATFKNEPLPDFILSNYGRLYSTKRRKLKIPQFGKQPEEAFYRIRRKEKSKDIYIKNIVAETFIHNPNPATHIYVRQIDGDKHNNIASNLKWCDRVTPKKHFDETIDTSGIDLIADDEVFAIARNGDITYMNYLISNYGRLYSRRRGTFPKGAPNTDGYLTYMFGVDEKKAYATAHRLVAFAFVHNPNIELFDMVNHKDENKLNNHYKNLEWCTHEYNMQYNNALYKRQRLPVKQYDQNGKLIAIHDSMTAAGRVMGVGMSTVRNWCRNSDRFYMGYRWERVM